MFCNWLCVQNLYKLQRLEQVLEKTAASTAGRPEEQKIIGKKSRCLHRERADNGPIVPSCTLRIKFPDPDVQLCCAVVYV